MGELLPCKCSLCHNYMHPKSWTQRPAIAKPAAIFDDNGTREEMSWSVLGFCNSATQSTHTILRIRGLWQCFGPYDYNIFIRKEPDSESGLDTTRFAECWALQMGQVNWCSSSYLDPTLSWISFTTSARMIKLWTHFHHIKLTGMTTLGLSNHHRYLRWCWSVM